MKSRILGLGVVAITAAALFVSTAMAVFAPIQNFDGVAAPALPTGWTASTAIDCPTSNPWATSNAGVPAPVADSAPNAAFVNDPICISDERLVSPVMCVTSEAAVFEFRQNRNMENGFDGGVLEVSVNNAAYADVLASGATFGAGGYNGVISLNFGSPIAGRQAWTGNSAGFVTTTVNLPAGLAGQSVIFRFRRGTDSSVAGQGWRIDSIQGDGVGECQNGVVRSADVSVTKSATPDPVLAGANLTYTLDAGNAGPIAAANVSLTDLVPANTTLVSFVQTAGATPFTVGCAAGTCTATTALWPAGETATFTLVVKVNPGVAAGSTLTNTATIGTTTVDNDPSNNAATITTSVLADSDVRIGKAISPVIPAPGSVVTYRIRVRNVGPSTALGVVMNDPLPAGYEFVSWVGNSAGCNTPTNPNPVIECTRASMAPNTSATWTFTARTPLGPDGREPNVATVTSTTADSNLANNTATEAATLQ